MSYQDIRFSLPVLQEINQKFFLRKEFIFKDSKENTKFEFKNQKFKNVFFFYDEKEIILENLNFDLTFVF